MELQKYLALPTSLTVSALRERMVALGSSIKSDAQIRQWQHRYGNRLPDATNCVFIERATAEQVRRWDLRPDDWHEIWPELIGKSGAPAVQQKAVA